MRYEKEVAWKFFGDKQKAQQYTAQARVVAGELLNANVNELEQVTRRVQLAEDVWCQVRSIPGQVIIELHATSEIPTSEDSCCQGFVVKNGGVAGQFCWNDSSERWRWKSGSKCKGGNVVWHNGVAAYSFDARTRYTAEDLSQELYKNGKLLWQAPKTIVGVCQTENFVVAILGGKFQTLELWFKGEGDWEQGSLTGEALGDAKIELMQPVLFNSSGTIGVATVIDKNEVQPYDYDFSEDYDFGWYDLRFVYKNYTITLTESFDGVSGVGSLTPGSTGTSETTSAWAYGNQISYDNDSSCIVQGLSNETQSYYQDIYADGTVDVHPAVMDRGTLNTCNCGECTAFTYSCGHCKSDYAWLMTAHIVGSPCEQNRCGTGGYGSIGGGCYCCTGYCWCGLCGSSNPCNPDGSPKHEMVEIQVLNLDKYSSRQTSSSSNITDGTRFNFSTYALNGVRKITLRRDFDGDAEVTAEIELTSAETGYDSNQYIDSDNTSTTETTSSDDSCIATYNQTPFLHCDQYSYVTYSLSWSLSYDDVTESDTTVTTSYSANTKSHEIVKVTFRVGATELVVLDIDKDYSKVDSCNSVKVNGTTSTWGRSCAMVYFSSDSPYSSLSGSVNTDIVNAGKAEVRKVFAYDIRCGAILYLDRVLTPVATNTINKCSLAPAVTQIKLRLPNGQEKTIVTDAADSSLDSLEPVLPTLSNYTYSSSSPATDPCTSSWYTSTYRSGEYQDINYYEWVLRRFVEEDYAAIFKRPISCMVYSPRVQLFFAQQLPEKVKFCCNEDTFGHWMISGKVTTSIGEYTFNYLESAEGNDPLSVSTFPADTYFPHISVIGR